MDRKAKLWIVGVLVVWVIILLAFSAWQHSWTQEKLPPREEVFITEPPTPTDEIAIVFIDGIPTAVAASATVAPPTATNTPLPTFTATPTVTPEFTATPTPIPPTPTKKVDTTEFGKAGVHEVPGDGHTWKPFAWYTAADDRTMPQWRLQQIAKTDENGLRYVIDDEGTRRYCVALPVFWAGGNSKNIGRCFDVQMRNGATIHCVLGDTKRIEKSLRGEGKFGQHNEVLEFQVDVGKLPEYVRLRGTIDAFGGALEGELSSIITYDKYIAGFGSGS